LLLAVSCIDQEGRVAWDGIQAERQEIGAPTLRWDAQAAPYVARRWAEVAESGLSHDGFTAALNEYNAREPVEEVCEIALVHGTEWSETATLELWKSSPGHWGCAMNSRYTSAAIASGWAGERYYAVMWLVR